MSMTSESDERMISSGVDSPSLDDANSGGTTGGNGPLKKGPWTSAEDAILVEYVNKHGEGNWNAVQKHSGLARCGKSCRLRWANHLRPDLKKGAFTPEEERRIIELHAKMGNKWARMAAELPGRTDNEIKNYWNTRIKRRQRAGLPIYPPDICMQAMNETQQNDAGINGLSSTDVCHPEFIPVNGLDIPAVQFKNLELYQHSHQSLLNIPASSVLDVPTSSLLNSYSNKLLYPPAKRLRESEPPFTGLNPVGIGDTFLGSGGCQYPSDQISQSFILPPPYDHHNNLNSTDHAMTPSSLLPGSHAVLNGNASSEPTSWAMKPELPSLQNQVGSWGLSSPSSPLPFYESVDILIETPPNEHDQVFNNLETQNSGLLDAILYESVAKKNSNTNSMMPNGIHETEWEAYDDQFSPLGHSSSSVCTPMSGNSFDEPHSNVTFPVKEEASNLGPIQYDDKGLNATQMFFSRPDYLLASNCFVPMNHPTRDGSSLKDALGKFLVDDFNRDNKETDTDATSSGQGHVHDSCGWNAMSTV